MNIVPPIPTTITFNSGVVNNEAARRDNSLRDTVPALTQSENSSAEKGFGSESERAKTPGQIPQAATYERPQSSSSNVVNGQSNQQKDSGNEQSEGKEGAESRQQQQQQENQDAEVAELKQRDLEVKSHEQAHAAIGGQYAAAPQYEYTAGPNGHRYVVDGEVSIDISDGATPEETIRKMQQVKASALAPAEPSAQDLRVAAEASQKLVEARNEIAEDARDNAVQAFEKGIPENLTNASQDKGSESITGDDIPSLNDIADNIEVTVPTRSLDRGELSSADDKTEDAVFAAQIEQFNANRDENIVRRLAMIENFYQQVTTPRIAGFQQSV